MRRDTAASLPPSVEDSDLGLLQGSDSFWSRLGEFDNYAPRGQDGDWLVWGIDAHELSDLVTAGCFVAIACALLFSRTLFGLLLIKPVSVRFCLALAIFWCGLDHAMSRLAFDVGIYDQQILTKIPMAVFALTTLPVITYWCVVEARAERRRVETESHFLDEDCETERPAKESSLPPDLVASLREASRSMEEASKTLES